MVDFLIVGTPRSGTTLLQRLASEVAGVRVPPETHFFRLFAEGLLRRRAFPLEGAALRAELARFSALETSRGLDVRADEVVERLGGRCAGAVELFGALVRQLAGDAPVVGEKTPSHLAWWRPLTHALPRLRLVGIVREPRAVVDSYTRAWGPRPHAVIAHRWAVDQRELRRAARALGPERCRLLRYEDVVGDPDGARSEVAALIGADDRRRHPPAPLFLPWESWKSAALEPVTTVRIDAWRTRLDARQARDVARICRAEMRRWGYACDDALRLPLDPAGEWAGRRYRLERAVRDRRLTRLGRLQAFGSLGPRRREEGLR